MDSSIIIRFSTFEIESSSIPSCRTLCAVFSKGNRLDISIKIIEQMLASFPFEEKVINCITEIAKISFCKISAKTRGKVFGGEYVFHVYRTHKGEEKITISKNNKIIVNTEIKYLTEKDLNIFLWEKK